MDDMVSKISEMLSTEDGQKSIQNIISSLGLGGGDKGTKETHEAPEERVPEGIDLKMLSSIQQVLSTMKADDKDAALLRALKPHLSEEKRDRVDEALRIMQLINALPLIQKSGLFGGDEK